MKNITDLYLEMKKIMMVENTKFWYVGILDKKKKKKKLTNPEDLLNGA